MLKEKVISVLKVLGMLLTLEGIFMSLALVVSLIYRGVDTFAFFKSTIITLIFGLTLTVFLWKNKVKIDRKLGFLIVSLIWLIMSAFGALPYWIGNFVPSYTDAYFETMSGFTTTGASIFPSVEALPKGILFWRSMTNWIGGIGIVVIVVSFIPFIGGGGMSLFSAEVAGPSKGKFSPHIRTTGKILISIYLCLTLTCVLSLYLAGLDLHDSFCNSFSALSSGGFSTKNSSAAAYSPLVQYLLIFFMIPSGINFTLMYYATKGQFRRVFANEELRAYFAWLLGATFLIAFLIYTPGLGIEKTIRNSLFQVTSLLTSTGFVNDDYTKWVTPAMFMLFLIMFSGAMSGSTTGGLKIIRILLLFKNARRIVHQGIHSNAYLPVRLEKRIVPDNVIYNVLAIFLLYFITFFIVNLILIASGLGLFEAVGGTVSCLSNMGPGLGECGGFGNYANFSPFVKWVFAISMYLGRLEFFTVFALFIPSFWKK